MKVKNLLLAIVGFVAVFGLYLAVNAVDIASASPSESPIEGPIAYPLPPQNPVVPNQPVDVVCNSYVYNANGTGDYNWYSEDGVFKTTFPPGSGYYVYQSRNFQTGYLWDAPTALNGHLTSVSIDVSARSLTVSTYMKVKVELDDTEIGAETFSIPVSSSFTTYSMALAPEEVSQMLTFGQRSISLELNTAMNGGSTQVYNTTLEVCKVPWWDDMKNFWIPVFRRR